MMLMQIFSYIRGTEHMIVGLMSVMFCKISSVSKVFVIYISDPAAAQEKRSAESPNI